jgi:hypothetical protein
MSKSVSYKRHRFPPQIIAHAVWLYFRFPLSLRLVEEMLLERGITVSYETVRRWALKFGPAYTRRLRRKPPSRRDICWGRLIASHFASSFYNTHPLEPWIKVERLCRRGWSRWIRDTPHEHLPGAGSSSRSTAVAA